ncbi:bis(5'-nucleosyl)-tetraphosphatase (symmetrical) YqeK [Treponema zioleckii]|uniref:bis(5'-nucleosyl)-tetraphosphatase (symmetrical) YqeK n=1 Tax=Treponema zioleckii TaxID=331680 RepID=UPI00168B40FA|nr:bis(5'-nucleosyl)-tetraphosphatase (symmetrical) YqeK [Treponema zioleckii]
MALQNNDVENPLFERIRGYAEKNLSKSRYEHSMRTAQTAAELCRLYGLPDSLGWISGIAHDICKEIPADKMIALAKRDGNVISQLELDKPALLHGRAAAIKVQDEFGISDKNIIDAIANHTLGAVGLCDLGKILFVADKIEPGRPQSTEEYRKNLYSKSLNGITLAVLDENIEYLKSKGKTAAPVSIEFAEQLRNL